MSNKDQIHVLSRAVILDQGSILLCRTNDLPTNFYFLPGGHVEHGESVETSLLRELTEETGAHCYIKRFLGCLEYSFEPGHSSICHNHEYNFIFEVGSENLKYGIPLAQLETHIELSWVPFNKIAQIDFRAEPLQKLLSIWLQTSPTNLFQSVMEARKKIST